MLQKKERKSPTLQHKCQDRSREEKGRVGSEGKEAGREESPVSSSALTTRLSQELAAS